MVFTENCESESLLWRDKVRCRILYKSLELSLTTFFAISWLAVNFSFYRRFGISYFPGCKSRRLIHQFLLIWIYSFSGRLSFFSSRNLYDIPTYFKP